MAKEEFRYKRKWARAVTVLAVWAVLLLPLGLLAAGTARIVLLCLAAAMFVSAWWIRLRCLTCQGCGKSCAPLMVKKYAAPACPYCGRKYVFDDELDGKK